MLRAASSRTAKGAPGYHAKSNAPIPRTGSPIVRTALASGATLGFVLPSDQRCIVFGRSATNGDVWLATLQ